MAKLVISLNGVTVREFPLGEERITLGRNMGNDIELKEPVVSGEHAAIQMKPSPTITDLQSTNGTRLNGKGVTKAPLKHNDVITIGSHELRFVDEDVQDFASTMIMFSDPGAEQEKTAVAALKLLNGPRAGEVMKIEKQRTALGTPGVQVAVINKSAQGYELLTVDVSGVAVSTRVNGEAVGPQARPLQDGDIITIADARLQFIAKL